jgi:hypothetical protein
MTKSFKNSCLKFYVTKQCVGYEFVDDLICFINKKNESDLYRSYICYGKMNTSETMGKIYIVTPKLRRPFGEWMLTTVQYMCRCLTVFAYTHSEIRFEYQAAEHHMFI